MLWVVDVSIAVTWEVFTPVVIFAHMPMMPSVSEVMMPEVTYTIDSLTTIRRS